MSEEDLINGDCIITSSLSATETDAAAAAADAGARRPPGRTAGRCRTGRAGTAPTTPAPAARRAPSARWAGRDRRRRRRRRAARTCASASRDGRPPSRPLQQLGRPGVGGPPHGGIQRGVEPEPGQRRDGGGGDGRVSARPPRAVVQGDPQLVPARALALRRRPRRRLDRGVVIVGDQTLAIVVTFAVVVVVGMNGAAEAVAAASNGLLVVLSSLAAREQNLFNQIWLNKFCSRLRRGTKFVPTFCYV